jgi:hypothetical protein
MGTKSPFQNWHIDAYLEGRLDEVPAEALPIVKDIAERRTKAAAIELGVRVVVDGEDPEKRPPISLTVGDLVGKDELTQLVVDHTDEE